MSLAYPKYLADCGTKRAAILPTVVVMTTDITPFQVDSPQPDVDDLHALTLLLGGPLLLFVLIAVAVYLPAMIRGEKLLPDHTVEHREIPPRSRRPSSR